jgi:heme oxygenase
MSLKDITTDLHTAAEQTAFAKLLLSGTIDQKEYTKYLYNMFPIYTSIEIPCFRQGVFATLPGIARANEIYQDIMELDDGSDYYLTPSTIDYITYLMKLTNDPARKHLIKAHLYVRHMGDLFGGQYIASKVPGSGKFYQFADVEGLKTAIRNILTDDLGDEARVAFEWSIKIMKELGSEA